MISVKVTVPSNLASVPKKLKTAAIEALRNVGMAVLDEWKNEAGRKLTKLRVAYQNALQMSGGGTELVSVYLQQSGSKNDKMANAIEGGMPAYSIFDTHKPKFKMRDKPIPENQFQAMKKYLISVGRWGKLRTEYLNVPIYAGMAKQGGTPDAIRMMSKNTSKEKWQHPGFKPKGSGGLNEPLRLTIVKYAVDKIPEIFSKVFSKVSV